LDALLPDGAHLYSKSGKVVECATESTEERGKEIVVEKYGVIEPFYVNALESKFCSKKLKKKVFFNMQLLRLT